MSRTQEALVDAWRLDGQGGGHRLAAEDVDAMIAAPDTVWIHFDYGRPGAAEWLRDKSGLSELVQEALLADDPRPRSLQVGDGLLVILRGVNLNADSDPEDMISLRVFIEHNRIITLRRRRLASIAAIREALEAGRGPVDTSDFLVDLVQAILERIADTVGEVDDLADELEEQVIQAESRELRTRLGRLRRQAIALRRYIAPQRDTLARLPGERVPWLNDMARARLREAGDRITRCVEDLDSARDRAAVTQEELNNRLAEQMNRTMYVLSIVAAIFLPLGLLTGLLGINVGGMPGTESHHAFGLVTIALLALGWAEFRWFRRRNWL